MIVIQYTDINEDKLLKITYNHHKASCYRFGYEYRVYQKPFDPSRHCYWQKPLAIQHLLREGHEQIVWLDTDALWLGRDHLLPEIDSIGAVYLWNHSYGYPHHNVGVLYVNQKLSEVIDKWIDEPDDGHPHGDNYAFSKMVARGDVEVTDLPFRWNSFVYLPVYYSKGDTVVAAWHGARNRERLMMEYFENNIRSQKGG